MPFETTLLILIIVAGFYMAWNIGANDVANAMGTSVGSGALTLRQAVCVAAVLEFVGAFFFGSHVSETIQTGIVDTTSFADQPQLIVYGMLASLIAAGVWLQVASYYGWPVSTTHTIVGAIVGFGFIIGGVDAIYWDQVGFIVSSWILSPLFGGCLSYFIFTILRKKIFYTSSPVEAAKRLAPVLLFSVVAILSFILASSGLKDLDVPLTFLQKVAFSSFAGGAAALVCYVFLLQKKWTFTSPPKELHQESENVLESLEKAKKHLLHAQEASGIDRQFEVSILLEEVETLKHSYAKPHPVELGNAQYAIVERIFGYLQVVSACLMAFAHGANDVANAIGPLSAAINVLRTGALAENTPVPTWALGLGGVGIVIGLATWGWRVIETIGKKITELTPSRGFAAEFGAAVTIVLASGLGLPISTTHTLVGAVLGVGLARGLEALNLTTMRDIVISWVITVPIGALLCIVFFELLKAIF